MSDINENSEEQRVEAEEGRTEAEGGRVEAEGGRVLAEEGRVTEEDIRQFEEAERQRREAEKERIAAEGERAHAESNEGSGRVEQEIKRVAAEEARVSAQKSLKYYVRRAVIGYVILAIGMTLGLYFAFHNDQRINEGRVEARLVLCLEVEKVKEIRRDELRLSIRRSEDFLEENPEGIPGISAALIRQGINSNKDTLENLKALDCKYFSNHPEQFREEQLDNGG